MAEDDDEIFTNFASWTATYLNYIRSTSRREMDTVPTNAWLTLQAIGPWRIGNSTEMRDLVSIILAVFKTNMSI